jgi:hypothetical protein
VLGRRDQNSTSADLAPSDPRDVVAGETNGSGIGRSGNGNGNGNGRSGESIPPMWTQRAHFVLPSAEASLVLPTAEEAKNLRRAADKRRSK